METISWTNTRFPLYVEIVPLQSSADFPDVCTNLVGNVALIVYGQSVFNAPCGAWEEAETIDITNIVPLGSLYALRLYFLRNVHDLSIPSVNCIRVTAHPVETTIVSTPTWGRVKAIFK